jgi:hypothetical protein
MGGFVGVVLACATLEANSCVLVSSYELFPTLERCTTEAAGVKEVLQQKGSVSAAFCFEVMSFEKEGELL